MSKMIDSAIIIQGFNYSAGGLLIVTGMVKLISGFGNAGILQVLDPLFHQPFRYELWIVGVIEIISSVICFSTLRLQLKAAILASRARA